MDGPSLTKFIYKYYKHINTPMIAPLDARTRQFYMEMGYSEQQVIKAHEYAIRKKIDILDALGMQLQSAPSAPPPPPRQANNPPAASSAPALPTSSFLTPLSQARPAEYEVLFSRSSKFNPLSSRFELREPNHPVGLLNISNCCYLNSLLQCYFLMHKFKQILLTAEPLQEISEILAQNKTKLKRVKGEYELLAKLKHFFTLMALTSKKYLDPTNVLQNLVDSVGEKLTYGEEKDLSEINIMVIERLSQGLTFSKKYFQKEDPEPQRGSFIDQGEGRRYNSIFNPETGLIKQLFYGTKVQYYREKQIGKQEQVVSDFTGIILNPRFGTLENALDEQFNFSVEIKGETFSKQMFIREEPEYLFLYINRTQFDRQEQQMHKNDQKFTFDFVLYLDRYMEKYREERGQKDEKIRSLIQMRNRVKEQLSSLQILAKKMEECYEFARGLQGWVEKLPSQEEFQAQERRLFEQLAVVQRELQQVQSRREEYHLMYIFVHRGDAVSGHYWGYGRNGGSWYRFDINCRLIPQEQILIDMEKSSGTPYALLFVKKENLPQFKYNYHVNTNIRAHQPEYAKLFDEKLAEGIIRDNILLHQEVQAKNYEILKKKCFADYVARYNTLKKITKIMVKPKAEGSRLDSLPLCNNFTLFLQSKGEAELYKFSVFQQSLLASSGGKVTIERLMHDADLLTIIQKKFKLKCKGQLHLKNYAMVGKDLEKYLRLQQEYQLTVFEVIWGLTATAAYERLHPFLEKIGLKGDFIEIQLDGGIAAALSQVIFCLRVRSSFLKSEQYQKMESGLEQVLYMGQVNNEVSKLITLKLVSMGFKFESLGKFVELADSAGTQIATINASNAITTSALEIQSSYTIVEELQELIRRFFAQSLSNNRKGSVAQSASKVDRRSSSKLITNLDSVSSSGTSPFKSGTFSRSSTIQNKRVTENKLTTFTKSAVIFLDTRQTWKTEQIQGSKANFDFSNKIIAFLKRLAPIVRVYRKALQAGRALSPLELSSLGVILNHPRLEPESLI